MSEGSFVAAPLVRPLFTENPITVQILGVCSALAVTRTLETAIAMSLAVTAVLVCSNAAVSFIRHEVPRSVRLIVQITLVATFVIVVDQVLQAALVAVRVVQAVHQAAVDGDAAVGRHLAQVETGSGHQEVAVEGIARGQLDQVRLAEAVLADDRAGRAAGLVRRRQPFDQVGALAFQPDSQLLDVLGRGYADPQRLQQLACVELVQRHRLQVKDGHRRGRGRSGLLLAGKLLARPAKAQPALETHQPLAAVAKNGDDRARPKLWMLDGRADAWGVNHSPIHHSPINSASSRRRCLDFGSRRLYVATSSTR